MALSGQRRCMRGRPPIRARGRRWRWRSKAADLGHIMVVGDQRSRIGTGWGSAEQCCQKPHDDEDSDEDGDEVGEEGKRVLDVVQDATVCPLDDLLRVVHHVELVEF